MEHSTELKKNIQSCDLEKSDSPPPVFAVL